MTTNKAYGNSIREKLGQMKNKLASLRVVQKQLIDAAISQNIDKVSALNIEIENTLRQMEALISSTQSHSFRVR